MRRAVRLRWRAAALFWGAQALAAYLLWPVLSGDWDGSLGPSYLRDAYLDTGYILWILALTGVMVVLQAVFLLPVRRPRVSGGSRMARAAHHGLSGLAVGVLAGSASFLGALALEFFGQRTISGQWALVLLFWVPLGIAWPAAWALLAWKCGRRTPVALSVVIAGLAAGLLMGGIVLGLASVAGLLGGREEERWFGLAILVMFIGWIAGSVLLIPFAQRRPPAGALGRFSSVLLLGTIVEVAAIIPLDVMARRKTDCYCGEGSFWALTVCWAVGVFALGPAIWLLPLSRRRQRWYQGRCVVCGYDMRGCRDAERCPECGAGWRTAASA